MIVNKNILVITPFFAPETHAAVFRAHKLVKYLKKAGWNPIVLTVDTNYVYNEDEHLLKELDDVPIYRARYIEPTLRGVRMALTGKDLTFKTLKKQGYYNSVLNNKNDVSDKDKPTNIALKTSIWSRFYNYLLEHHLNNPDRYWTWKKNAVALAENIIKKENIGIIYTSSLPFTTLEIGSRLKLNNPSLKWVLDYRDPVMYAYKTHSQLSTVKARQYKIEKKAFTLADKITMLGYSYTLIYHEMYNGLFDDKISFIPTGLDDDLIPQNIEPDNDIIEWIFVGEYLHEYKDYFFQIFRKFQEKHLEFASKIRIKIIGNKNINLPIILPYAADLIQAGIISLIDHMPQKELYQHIKNADAAILIPGYKAHWWNNFAKMVDYIALQKPVLAMIPNPSEARSELIKAGLGVFIDDDVDGVENMKKLVSGELQMNTNLQYCTQYLASNQAASFIKIFESLQL